MGAMNDMMESGLISQEPIQETIKIDFLELAREADASSTAYFDANVRNVMKASMDQFHGRHADNSSYNSAFFKARSKLFIPKTRSNIRKHEAMCAAAYFSTQDVVQVAAFNDNDKSQLAAADFYKEVMNLRLTSSGPRSIPWYKNLMGAYQDTMTAGVAISFQGWDYQNNRPKTELIEPENFRFDPACNWVDPIRSSPYLIQKIPMRVGEIREKIVNGEFDQVTDEEMASARRPDSNSVSQARNQGRSDPTQRSNSTKEFDIVWVHLNIIKQHGIDWVYYTLGPGDAYLTQPEPLDRSFPQGRPFVLGVCVIESHKNYPTSLPQMVKDLQAYSNTMTNQRIDKTRASLDQRYIVRATARVDTDSLMRNSPGSITMAGDPEKDIKIFSSPDVNPSAYKEPGLLDLAIDDLMGGFNGSSAQAQGVGNKTVGGMSIISEQANQVAEYQLKTFNETWVEPVLQQLLIIEQHFNTDADFLNLAAENADLVKKYGEVNFSDIHMKDVMLTVQVGMGASNPATRLEKFVMGTGAFTNIAPMATQYGMNMQECAKEIFGALGYKDGSRFFNKDVDPGMQALQDELAALKQELANKRNPAIDAAQVGVLKATEYKIRTEASFGNVNAAKHIALMPAIGPIADAIAMVNGSQNMGGQDPNFDSGVPQGMGGALMGVAAQDPDTIVAAGEQARMFDAQEGQGGMPENTTPMQPPTGMAGMLPGENGGGEFQ